MVNFAPWQHLKIFLKFQLKKYPHHLEKRATLPKTGEDATRLGLHILNTFDIFEGAIQNSTDNAPGIPPGVKSLETTEWVVLHDRTNLKTYFRTYEGLDIQMVDLKKIDFSKEGFRQIPLSKKLDVKDVTQSAQPLYHDRN